MTPTEMEMRVARALYEVEGGPGQTPWDSDTLKSYRENVMYKKARAAIQAMREPPQSMFAIAEQQVPQRSMLGLCWQAMINAASHTTDGDK